MTTNTPEVMPSASPPAAPGAAPLDPRTCVGVVVIGRNEGTRLERCLRAVVGTAAQVVYVDSGSTDGSVVFARSLGATVVELDATQPFTAARARNAGLDRLLELAPALPYVQFVDGDCELVPGWLAQGVATLAAESDVVAVFGRVRERQPDASVYNRLCDLDWDLPVGPVRTCGGIALMRVAAVRAAGGFDPTLIAGEEPELCLRLRLGGGRILRVLPEMCGHDAAMTRFGQWWRRTVRTGHAYAEVRARHRRVGFWARPVRSAILWGLFVPAVIVLAAWPTRGWSAMLLLGYAVLGARVYRYQRGRGRSPQHARLLAAFELLAKLPLAQGVLKYWWNRLRRRPTALIEYRQREAASS
jgi:GT2 family glycosyltransferase